MSPKGGRRAWSASLVINQILPQGESTPSLSPPPRSNEHRGGWLKAKNDSLYKPIRRTTPPFVSFDKGGGKSKTRIIIFPPLTKTSDQSSLVPLCGSASDKEIQMKVTLPIERGSCVEIRAERERERGEGRATKQESSIKGWRSALTLSYSASNGE